MSTLISSKEVRSRNIQFYDEHAQQYCRDTADLDMSKGRAKFLAYLPRHARILDAGAGSGRDSVAFLKAGHHVQAIDASPELVREARSRGVPSQVKSFQQVDDVEAFNGIWACASLLHVPRVELVSVLRRLRRALRPDGVMYITLKYGTGEAIASDGRFFCYHTPEEFAEQLEEAHLELVRHWNSDDKPAATPTWVTYIVRRPRG